MPCIILHCYSDPALLFIFNLVNHRLINDNPSYPGLSLHVLLLDKSAIQVKDLFTVVSSEVVIVLKCPYVNLIRVVAK